MMPEEKEQRLALLDHQRRLSRDAEGRDADRDAVQHDEDAAVAWDVTGALCGLLGWRRACVLFGKLDPHVNGRPVAIGRPTGDAEMHATGALRVFNDKVDVTFETVRERIETMPVWHGNGH